jgi:hypothetical protein
MKRLTLIVLIVSAAVSVHAAQFEELEKPPEGAHKGQILLGAFASIGVPYGRIIKAEGNFVRNSTYTFTDNLITKKIMLQHLFYSYGIFFEYMPVDHLGLKAKIKKSNITQRSQFGAEYQNWSKTLYSEYSFFIGPTVHFTARKQWDIGVTPLVGYAIGEYNATPIARRLVYTMFGFRKKNVNNVVIGSELNVCIYFSGGFYMSFGCDWAMNMLTFGRAFQVYNMQTYKNFFPGGRSSYLHSVSFILSAGYAFSN